MSDWVKLYKDDTLGEVLVLLDTNEGGYPIISIKVKPEGAGVCGVELPYDIGSEDEQWNNAESYFNTLTEEQVIEIARAITKEVSFFFSLEDF